MDSMYRQLMLVVGCGLSLPHAPEALPQHELSLTFLVHTVNVMYVKKYIYA
jgi:hypothetical protein